MISQKIKLSIYGVCLAFLALFTTEHITKQHYPTLRPSILIEFIGDHLNDLFTKIGNFLAYLSSFYTYIKLGDLYDTLVNLIDPIMNLIASPLAIIKGYFEASLEYRYPFMIGLGTMTLIGLCYLAYKKRNILLSKIKGRSQTTN